MGLESLHYSPEHWAKRQQIRKFQSQKPQFSQMMASTRGCMRNNPQFHNDVSGAIACETIHPDTMKTESNYTMHTHPHGDIDYPSDLDIQTTNKLGKDYLLIGLATKDKVVVYHKSDNFQNKVAEF